LKKKASIDFKSPRMYECEFKYFSNKMLTSAFFVRKTAQEKMLTKNFIAYEKLITSAFFQKPFVTKLVADVDIPDIISLPVLLWLMTKDRDVDVLAVINNIVDVLDAINIEEHRDMALRKSGLTGEVFNFLYIIKNYKAPKCLPYTFKGYNVEFSGPSRTLETNMSVLEIDQLSLLVRMYTLEEALSKKVHNGIVYHLHKHWYEKRLRCLARRFHRRLTEVQFVEILLRKHQKRCALNGDKGVVYRHEYNSWIHIEYGEQIEPEEEDIRSIYLLDTLRAYDNSTRLPRMCDLCGSVDESDRKHLRCARCRTASYCSRACQTLHWYTHKAICTPLPYISKREFYRAATKDEHITNEIEGTFMWCDLFK
jgi:ethanolamine utilization protein EutP (predicted NTPase)